ncbi:MAG: dioxygenase [Pseudomonadota bacterium]
MRSVHKDNITDAFMGYCAETTEPRLAFVLSRLVTHLHAFAKEVDLTHEEWLAGIELLYQSGKISSPQRNEFILLSDVLGLSSLVDMINSGGGTELSPLGPFFIEGAPLLPCGADLIGDNPGDTLAFHGRVLEAASGVPIADALLDVWQTASNGLYSNQDPDQADYNLRFKMRTGADGGFAFTTVRPEPYSVPEDGPVGKLLRATGRHAWRPAHFHFLVAARGGPPLTTEIFMADDPYLDEDAVFGVRKSLIVEPVRETDPASVPYTLAAPERLRSPFGRIDYDFRL